MLRNKSRLEALHGVKELDNQAAETIWGGSFNESFVDRTGMVWIRDYMGNWIRLDCDGKDAGSAACKVDRTTPGYLSGFPIPGT